MTITATVRDGYAWEQMPRGWTQLDSATATYTVELVAASCDEVAPAAPTVTRRSAQAGS